MRVVVVYESMFGNTKEIAEAIAAGAETMASVALMHASEVNGALVASADLLVVGAPTHAWHMSTPASRQGAADKAAKSNGTLTLEPHAVETGVREWLESKPKLPHFVAVFDTRVDLPVLVSGHASRSMRRLIKELGAKLSGPGESFLVTKADVLLPGEAERAERWGRELAIAAEPISLRGSRDDLY